MDKVIKHYGTPRHSGRYPWGSGDDPYQRSSNFIAYVKEMRAQGLSDTEIARGMEMSSTEFRNRNSLANAEKKAADIAMCVRLKNKGYSNTAIAERMGLSGESQVRNYLKASMTERTNITKNTVNMLKDQVSQKGYIDVGAGVENHLGISRTRLQTAVSALKDEGYKIHYLKIEQMGNPGKYTSVMAIGSPDSTYKEVFNNPTLVRTITDFSQDYGRSFLGLKPPRQVDSNRVEIRYAEDGGKDKDGVMEIRRGVEDLNMGNAKYAQVRIGVDGTHYLKGMAIYADDLPKGVDIRFNTNKSKSVPKMSSDPDNTVLKPIKKDKDNPFGATVRQIEYEDKTGKKQLSALNIVNEEGEWAEWSKTVSSQMLSKQPPNLAKQQLGLYYESKKDEYNDIKSLTNPVVKKKMLMDFADDADASAVHLEAAGFPRQRWQVILPIPSLKETEIYAPNFKDAENVVLIRYPHGGTFEIPELKVNNKNAEAKRIMLQANDAVGINPKVAQKLSGADFDGDSVLVIPNNNKAIKSSPSLKALENFDPHEAYPGYPGMPKMKSETKQIEMGKVSNLITDMTIQGAPFDEVARAVKHSMVVIDAEKHNLNYKQSAIDNGIAALKVKYQGGATKGASTIISKSTSEARVFNRREVIDPKTGKKSYLYPGDKYTTSTGEVRTYKGDSYVDKDGHLVIKKIKSTKGAETDDAHTLSSGTTIETVYADHANKLKALANTARKEALATKPIPYSPSAKKVYAKEVGDLQSKLNVALQNKPMERQAQILANVIVKKKKDDNPNMTAADLKKIKGQALAEARARSGAEKHQVEITPREWEAIQAGAVSTNTLNQILMNTDSEKVKQYAMPRQTKTVSASKLARARMMLNNGHTQADVADALGISLSTLTNAMKGE